MTNSKKLLLSLGTAATMVAPLATTVACGVSGFQGKYNTSNDGKIKIWSTFSSTGDQMQALQEMADKYNAVKDDADQPVEIVPLDGGYSAISSGLRTKFEANDKKTLPNVVIGYPDSLGTVARYDMQLDLGTQTGDDAMQYGVDRTLFDEQFVNNNDQIGGIEEQGALYTVPLAKSIDMLTSNLPVLNHIFNVLELEGATLSGKVAEIANGPTGGDGSYGADTVHIAEQMKPIEDAPSASHLSFGDEIFNDAEALLNFVIAATDYIDVPENQYILGIDSVTNFMYSYGYSMAGANFENFYFNKGEDGYIDYNFGDEDSAGAKNFATIYNKLMEAVNTDGIFIRDLGYSSDFSKNHQMGFSIGSTAGYSYNFVAGGSAQIGTPADSSAEEIKFDGSDHMMKVQSLVDQTDAGFDPTTDRIGTLASDFSTFTNGIYGSEYAGSLGSHDMKLDVPAADVASSLTVGETYLKDYQDGVADADHMSKIAGTVKMGESSSRFWYSVPAASITEDTAATAVTMQENEMTIQAPGGTFGSGANTTLLQGPSMFAVHSNDVQNNETRKFMEWMFSGSEDYGDGNEEIPAERFALGASYIVPSKTFLAADSGNESEGNASQQLAYATMQSIMNDDDHYSFDNPVDYTTSDTRDHIKSAIVGSWNNWDNGNGTHSLDTLYTNLRRYSSVFN